MREREIVTRRRELDGLRTNCKKKEKVQSTKPDRERNQREKETRERRSSSETEGLRDDNTKPQQALLLGV